MWEYPIFKSKENTYLKPSNFKSNSYILGIGKAFLLILLSSSLKSEMKQKVPFFLGIIHVEVAHAELFLHCKTHLFTNLLTSVFKSFFMY